MAAATLTGEMRLGNRRLSMRGRRMPAAIAPAAYTDVVIHGARSTRTAIHAVALQDERLEGVSASRRGVAPGCHDQPEPRRPRTLSAVRRRRDHPHVDRRSELQKDALLPANDDRRAYGPHVQFDALLGRKQCDRWDRDERIEVFEAFLDDTQQREFDIVGQTRAVSRVTNDGDAKA